MDHRRLYVIRLIVCLLFVLFVLLFNDARAQANDEATRNPRDDHKLILDIADELLDEEASEFEADSEQLDLLRQVSADSQESRHVERPRAEDELAQLGDEMFVEDDDDLEHVGPEEYDEPFRSNAGPEYEELPHCNQEKTGDDLPR